VADLGAGTRYTAPFISHFVQVNSTTIDVYVVHGGGTALTSDKTITEFIALNDSEVSVPISSASITGANTIRLNLSTPDTILRVSYMYGAAPDYTEMIRDNSPLAMPLCCTYNYVYSLGDQDHIHLYWIDEVTGETEWRIERRDASWGN
jgi:hypothetical protein